MEQVPATIRKQMDFLAETAKDSIRALNAEIESYGLSLSEEEITDLISLRTEALRGSGRVEFGEGILPKLIRAFESSPFMERESFARILAELQEAFYYYKSESEDLYTDEELIEFMVTVFNGRAQGSSEYLIGTGLDELVRYAKSSFDPYDATQAGDRF